MLSRPILNGQKRLSQPVSKRQLVGLCTSCQTCKLVSHADTKYRLATITVQYLKRQTRQYKMLGGLNKEKLVDSVFLPSGQYSRHLNSDWFLQQKVTMCISTLSPPPWMGSQSTAGFPPAVNQMLTQLMEKGTVRVSTHLAQKHNTMTWPWLRSRTLKSSVPTIRTLYLPVFKSQCDDRGKTYHAGYRFSWQVYIRVAPGALGDPYSNQTPTRDC